jgi:gamma-glutamyltranspeptidase/glutathione hydrolase
MTKFSPNQGVVAAGHGATAAAACAMLQEGGNAFDASLAAMLAACVAEPVLASPGGGGFLTARPAGRASMVADFFPQTPQRKRPAETVDIHPIQADFGSASQTFHIGMASIATPGFIRGLFAIHARLCRLPLRVLLEPALDLAREGVVVNAFQHQISRIVSPILLHTAESLALHRSPADPQRLVAEGERQRLPELADFLETLALEGERLFYDGEAGQLLSSACREQGGHLQRSDLSAYQVVWRRPLNQRYRSARIITNPLPALGGTLIGFALGLLEDTLPDTSSAGDLGHLTSLARVMQCSQLLRQASFDGEGYQFDPQSLAGFRQRLKEGGISSRGTTQISIADQQGNLASMTLSNGEGSAYVLPGTGIMLNNMLGEEDLNPAGINHWPEDRRLASMMSPTLLFTDDGSSIVSGSGGSNRIRSAILQVISNLIDFDMSLEEAVTFPRIHFESGLLSLEPPQQESALKALSKEFPQQQYWSEQNLFFGGAHTVSRDAQGHFSGIGDSRRGGVAIVV